jgi:hypothetical protein
MRHTLAIVVALLRGCNEFAMLLRWRLQAWMLRHGR